ncbi:MAG: xylulokinase [Caldilineae bacterium]|nr:MAG: xylulokinase [Caldilineae bacterium]
MSRERLLGLDLGTTSLKAVLLAGDTTLAGVSVPYRIHTPHPNWAEQDPETWFAAAVQATRRVLQQAGIDAGQVAAIGLSGQSHGLVCLDGAGQALRPAIIWADQRSRLEVAAVKEKIGEERLAGWTGNPLATGFLLPSWLWLRAHEPELAAQACKLLLPKDYLRFRLTGEIGTEPSDAGTTGLFDPAQGCWCRPLLEALDIDPALLPPVHPSSAVAGGLSQSMARATGLRAGTPVVFGGADQACQALGNGILRPGDLSSTIGTGGQLLAPLTHPVIDPHLRLHCYNHVVPGLWWSMGAILAAGLSLTWLRDHVLFGLTYEILADLAASAPPGSEGLIFLPHLAGERTPHMDPQARGGFIGLTLRHDRRHLCRAVMEGVVMALRQALDVMVGLGIPVERVIASGGGVRHPLWLQLQADIFARPVYRTRTDEAAAVGAGMLAGMGIGLYRDAAAAVAETVRWSEAVVMPRPEVAEVYARSYETFRRLYPVLRPLFVAHAQDPSPPPSP